METLYCDKWSNIKKAPWKMMDEAAAKLCHLNHYPYTALLCENSRPQFIIDVSAKLVSVSFLDERIRKYLEYDFEVTKSGRLFLIMAIYWEYEGEEDSENSYTIFGFRENGDIVMEKKDLKTGEVEERQTHESVEKNWEEYPQFGQYRYLCKEER